MRIFMEEIVLMRLCKIIKKLSCYICIETLITVYLCVYSLIDRVLKCIEHCATAKAYGKFREAGIMTKMEAVEENIIKSTKEKDNVEKGVN